MARTEIKDPKPYIAKFLAQLPGATLDKLDSPNFWFAFGGATFSARIDARSKDGIFMKAEAKRALARLIDGTLKSDDEMQELALQPADVPPLTPSESIRAFCKANGFALGSHLHGESFVISQPTREGRAWKAARLTMGGVEVDPRTFVLRGGALAVVHREGGVTPSLDLSKTDIPQFPYGMFTTR